MTNQLTNQPAEGPSILVIDDEESMRDACARVLTREGYLVQTAVDGKEGISLAKGQAPDIVLLDLKLPKMGGMEVLEELCAAVPDAVKVVFTAYATVSIARGALRQGAHDFLAKPFTPDELRETISRALEYRELLAMRRRLSHERQAQEGLQGLISAGLQEQLSQTLEELGRLQAGLDDRPQEQALAQQAAQRLQGLVTTLKSLGEDRPPG